MCPWTYILYHQGWSWTSKLLPPPECWDYRCISFYFWSVGNEHRALHMPGKCSTNWATAYSPQVHIFWREVDQGLFPVRSQTRGLAAYRSVCPHLQSQVGNIKAQQEASIVIVVAWIRTSAPFPLWIWEMLGSTGTTLEMSWVSRWDRMEVKAGW